MKKRITLSPVKKLRSEPLTLAPRKSGSPRKHHLLPEFTLDEKKHVLEYCTKNNISVSDFLARVALEDARVGKKAEKEEPLTVTINLPGSQRAKLLYIARLKEKSI